MSPALYGLRTVPGSTKRLEGTRWRPRTGCVSDGTGRTADATRAAAGAAASPRPSRLTTGSARAAGVRRQVIHALFADTYIRYTSLPRAARLRSALVAGESFTFSLRQDMRETRAAVTVTRGGGGAGGGKKNAKRRKHY